MTGGPFIVTKEHRRFAEFADAVKRDRYIGVCFGPAGVGKTVSGRRYAKWELAEPLLSEWHKRGPADAKAYAAVAAQRTVFYTPAVCCSFRELRDDVTVLLTRAGFCIGEHENGNAYWQAGGVLPQPDLLIVDEAERLATPGLEQLRDLHDRTGIGVILIGMPGIEKRLSRYPQLYSRIGFAHHYRALQGDELTFVLTRHWRQLGLALDDADFTDAQAIAAIARITGGNFRLLHRLFVQIGRILKINGLSVITDDVVEAARSTLVIGAT